MMAPVTRTVAAVLAAVAVLAASPPADAQTYRFVAPDGTLHLTNAPTDPRYRRLGFTVPPAAPAGPRVGAPVPFAREIAEAARLHGVPDALIAAVIRAESDFNPRAVSPKGARGLMQLMPATAAMLGVRDVFDASQNIDGGVRHLRALLERFGHDLPLALAAYNAGEHAVAVHGGIPPFAETRGYVARILGLLGGVVETVEVPAVTARVVRRTVAADGTVIYTNVPARPGR
jgi:soluble lytic murein transglycosylase-like protein